MIVSRNGSSSICKVAMCCMAAAMSSMALGYDEPIYTVTVAEGATNSLDSATVEVTQDGETTSAAFSDLSLSSGTFVKTGGGWLESSDSMSSFTGEVVVAEGAFVVSKTGQAGAVQSGTAKYKTSWADVARVVVSNGATLVLDNYPTLKQPVFISGRGVDGLGAICNRNTTSTGLQFYYAQITLLGDTTICHTSTGRLGFGYSVLDMNGFDLEFKSLDGRANQVMCGLNVKNPGNMLFDGTQGYFSATKTWEGSAENTVTMTNNAYFRMYNLGGTIPWTLVNKTPNLVAFSDSGDPSWNLTDNNRWDGGIQLDQDILMGRTVVAGDDQGITVCGPVTGSGCITLRHHWLRLLSSLNTFNGGVKVGDAGHLILYCDGSVPVDGGAIEVESGGEIAFAETNGTYNLPAVKWDVDSGDISTFWGGTNGTIASLTKTGDGTLALRGFMTVTGNTELVAGTLDLSNSLFSASVYSTSPGLNEKCVVYDVNTLTAAYDNTTKIDAAYKAFCDEGTFLGCDAISDSQQIQDTSYYFNIYNSGWSKYQFVAYDGYVWNRSPTNELWSFALSVTHRGVIMLDGEKVCETCFVKKGNYRSTSWYYLRTNTVEVTPGPHTFNARVFNIGFGKAGASAAYRVWDDENNCVMSNNNAVVKPTWSTGHGLVFNRIGNMTIDENDYEAPRNGEVTINGKGTLTGGDGFLFTRTSDSVSESDFTTLLTWSPLSNLVASAGTVIDAGSPPVPLTVPVLEGVTTVANGSLTVSSQWIIDASTASTGAGLVVDGALKFENGAAITVTSSSGHVAVTQETGWTIAEASGGITLPDGWQSNVTFPKGSYKLVLSDDGKKLQLYHYNGTVLILR